MAQDAIAKIKQIETPRAIPRKSTLLDMQGLRIKIGQKTPYAAGTTISTAQSTMHSRKFPQHSLNVTLYKLRELLKVRI